MQNKLLNLQYALKAAIASHNVELTQHLRDEIRDLMEEEECTNGDNCNLCKRA